MQCGLSVSEPQKKLWLESGPSKAESLLQGRCDLCCLSGTCLTRGIFWSAQELPSRSGQLYVTHLVTALEKVRTCMWETKIVGDQDCRRPRLQDALQSKPVLPY